MIPYLFVTSFSFRVTFLQNEGIILLRIKKIANFANRVSNLLC